MYINFWIIIFILMIVYTLCFCVKKEFFEEPKQKSQSISKKKTGGTKYTIVDVNKAVTLIKDHFLEKEKVNITITKIISIENSPQQMTLQMFIYNPITNVIHGNTVKVKLPISKKEKGEIISITKFTESPEDMKYTEKNMYQSLSFQDGTFK